MAALDGRGSGRHAAYHTPNPSPNRTLTRTRTLTLSQVVYPGDAAYSDMAFTRNGSVAVLLEKGFGGNPYLSVAFGVIPVPPARARIALPVVL